MKPHSELPQKSLDDLRGLAATTPPGCFVELGVYKGGSAFELYQLGRTLHLFDTFTGIPIKHDIDIFAVGVFADTTPELIQEAMPDAILHVGFFPGTLTEDLTEIAFVHIDCDQHQACLDAITLLWPRMVPGGIMAFDDWPFPGIKQAIKTGFAGQEPQFTASTHIPYFVK